MIKVNKIKTIYIKKNLSNRINSKNITLIVRRKKYRNHSLLRINIIQKSNIQIRNSNKMRIIKRILILTN
jgi:hypothetical protein